MCVRLAAVALCLLAGCRGATKADVRADALEAELRTRTRELEQSRLERDQLRGLAETYARQVQPGRPPFAPTYGFAQHEGGQPTLPLRDISLANGTGGVDDDGQPGDESLMVVVVPKDDDGTAVKLPGRLTVSVSEINKQGLKTPIGRWEIPSDALRKTWRSGLLASGYFVPLKWDTAPGSDRIRVGVQFVTLDGKPFEADKDVGVKPLPGVGPHGSPLVIPPPGVPDRPPPAGAEELPPPAARLRPAKPVE
jgi:hypothetical protein